LFLAGSAGTGKTFISLYKALKAVLIDEQYSKIIIIRSTVPTRDVGFLPGSVQDKIEQYELPYKQLVNKLFQRDDAYQYLKQRQIIQFQSTSFIRGQEFNDCICICDECQNMDFDELATIITRSGNNIKLIMIGDPRQSDFRNNNQKYRSDILKFINILKEINQIKVIKFDHNDIVRSTICKQFIIQCEKHSIYALQV
jgi:predicted ribonuclease YlaK